MPAKTRECPSCALTFEDDGAAECPYCGYEFPPETSSSLKWIALLLALLLAWPVVELVRGLF